MLDSKLSRHESEDSFRADGSMRDPNRTARARSLRRNQTSAEGKLWFYIRNRQVDGYKFIRQAPIEDYFADFLCRELKLVIEVDGATHSTDDEVARDARRTADLEASGYQVLRVLNDDIHHGLDGVIDAIHFAIEKRVRQMGEEPPG